MFRFVAAGVVFLPAMMAAFPAKATNSNQRLREAMA